MHGRGLISIWFFIGLLLLSYGIVITASGVYGLSHPPERPVVMADLHVDIWWGLLLTVIGAVYTTLFRPGRTR
jgi:Na+/phosphate symporter